MKIREGRMESGMGRGEMDKDDATEKKEGKNNEKEE